MNPGSRVKITGIYQILERNLGGLDRSMPDKGLKFHYIQMIGLGSENSYRKMTKDFSEEEINEFERFSKKTDIFEIISKNIAPSLFGHEEIKKAIALLMFGGTYI